MKQQILIFRVGDKTNFEIGANTGVVQITATSDPTFLEDKYVLKITASDGINKGRKR